MRSFSGGSEGEQAPAQAHQYHPDQPQQQVVAGEACGAQQKAFLDCMQANSGEMTMCQYYFDAMQKCKVSGDSLQY